MSRGRLVDAMRASYALPGIFQPVRINGRWLVDGALVNPVPVSAARALGAEMVIAVNLQTDVFGRGTIVHDHSADPIAEQAIERRHGRRRRTAATRAASSAASSSAATTARPASRR